MLGRVILIVWELVKLWPIVLPPRWNIGVRNFPFFIIAVSLLEILAFPATGPGDLVLCTDPYRRHELWRMLTVMFVHSSLGHLRGNVTFQLILGIPLEIFQSSEGVCAVYVFGVLGGSVAASVLCPESYAVGASAGVYALLAGHLAAMILNCATMDWGFVRLVWLLGYIGYEVREAIYIFLHLDSRIGHAAHLGGAVTGFIVGSLVFRTEWRPWKEEFRKFLLVLSAILLLTVAIANVTFPGNFYPSECNAKYEETLIIHLFKTAQDDPMWPEFQKLCLTDDKCSVLYYDYFS